MTKLSLSQYATVTYIFGQTVKKGERKGKGEKAKKVDTQCKRKRADKKKKVIFFEKKKTYSFSVFYCLN